MDSEGLSSGPSYSPGWKKPSDVMKLIRRRTSVSHITIDQSATTVTNSSKARPSDIGTPTQHQSAKRKNPFGCSNQGQKRLSNSFKQEISSSAVRAESTDGRFDKSNFEVDVNGAVLCDTELSSNANSAAASVFTKLDSAETTVKKKDDADLSGLHNQIIFGGSVNQSVSQTSSILPPEGSRSKADRLSGSSDSPVERSVPKDEYLDSPNATNNGDSSYDWRLRTRVRFTSSRSFDWCHPLSSVDEAQGTRSFVSCTPSPNVDSFTDVSSSEVKREFYRQVMYWMHPNLPWLDLFPRHIIDSRRNSGNAVWTSSEEVMKSLQASWSDSFTSAYQNIRTGVCPFLYVCGQHLTVLFHAQSQDHINSSDRKSCSDKSAGSNKEISIKETVASEFIGNHATHTSGAKVTVRAVLTPTSRGLREALQKEGVEFTMPLLSESRKQVKQQLKEQELEAEEQGTCISPQDSARVSEEVAINTAEKSSTPADGCASQHESNDTKHTPGGLAGCRAEGKQINDDDDENDDYEEGDDHNEAAGLWLEGLGLDRKKYKSLDPVKIKDERDIYRLIDYRSESTVLVESVHVNALFNYLINTPACLATTSTGQATSQGLVGVPPTLLAPTTFRGASLQSLKIRQFGAVRQQTGSTPAQRVGSTDTVLKSTSPCYMMELSGPVLPHTMHGLTRLLSHTQSGSLTVTSNIHEPSASLDALSVCLNSSQSNGSARS